MAILTKSFSVTGGDTVAAPIRVDPDNRDIKFLPLKFLPDSSVSLEEGNLSYSSVSSEDTWTGQKVWLLIPGFTADNTDLNDIGKAIHKAAPNDAILALDWTEASNTFSNNSAFGVLNGGLYRAASWITPVANGIRDKLISWGMPAAALNIAGHSLGAHLAGEIGASFNIYGSSVGSVTALDPASNKTRIVSPYDRTNGYDTDLSNGYINSGGIADPIKRLDIGAAASRSFNGMSSLSGNESQSGTAKESFLFDFGNNPYPITTPGQIIDRAAQFVEHSRVVTAYNNLITTTPITDPITGVVTRNSRLATNILGVNDTLADHQFRPNFYKGAYIESPQVHEAVIPVDAQDNPLFLVAAKLNGGIDDRFIYGTNSDDKFDSSLPFSLIVPFSKYYNNNGNHTYYLGNGDDTVFAGTGNDTIFGGAGNDYLDGGDGRNTIRGEGGNDNITGGSGPNILFGGLGNDTLDGGTGQSILRGSETTTNWLSDAELDVLIGSSGNLSTAFYIGDGTRNWYSSHGMNDYAEIQNFNAATDVILGGANIEAQNLINQTFLWSGNELVAKIDGLWASELSYFSIRA